MIVDLLFLFSLVYILMILLFAGAAATSRARPEQGYRPRVSVIIAARDEEEQIGACLESIVRLTYPQELLEIIIVDDRSTDRTVEIVSRFTDRQAHIRVLQIETESEFLPGKTNAVMSAVDISRGEILMFTDADCRVPPTWVENTVSYYSDPSVGVVAGFTSLIGETWFEEMQALDWFVLTSVAAATTRLGFPVTAVGTNLSVRREAYDSVGGYREIPFSVTEDYALFHAVTASGKWKARFPMDPATLVESTPCHDWKQLYDQKKRWFTGGRGMDAKSLLIFAFPYVFNFLILLGVFFSPWWAVGLAVAIKLLVDYLLCLPATLAFRRNVLLFEYPLFEIYYYMYVLIFPLLVIFRGEITWKERTFRN
jgi:cellulose synthase/poly-beta-1,6-N-acetylglucosamine synthase-like glycosyltransferase